MPPKLKSVDPMRRAFETSVLFPIPWEVFEWKTEGSLMRDVNGDGYQDREMQKAWVAFKAGWQAHERELTRKRRHA